TPFCASASSTLGGPRSGAGGGKDRIADCARPFVSPSHWPCAVAARLPLRGARTSTGAFQGWSGREDDGSADVAASCLGGCLGGVGEAVAGGDRNLKLPVLEALREFAQLVSVRTDVDAGDLMPRCWLGGSAVMVASRPSSATARIALAAPPRAALTAAATPW